MQQHALRPCKGLWFARAPASQSWSHHIPSFQLSTTNNRSLYFVIQVCWQASSVFLACLSLLCYHLLRQKWSGCTGRPSNGSSTWDFNPGCIGSRWYVSQKQCEAMSADGDSPYRRPSSRHFRIQAKRRYRPSASTIRQPKGPFELVCSAKRSHHSNLSLQFWRDNFTRSDGHPRSASDSAEVQRQH